ncbi:helix-turn-helix domain-containing protein [Roseivivax sp. CAU 1761]
MNAARLAVLVALASYADNETKTCFPAQGTLGKMLGASRAWVNKIIRELAEIGLIEKVSRLRSDQGTSSCIYRIRFEPDAPAEPHGEDSEKHSDFSAVTPVTGGVTIVDTNKTQTKNQTLSEIGIDDWMPRSATVDSMAATVGPKAAERFVARFRGKVAAKGYQYADWDAAVLEWFEADRQRGLVAAAAALGAGSPARKRGADGPATTRPAPDTDLDGYLARAEHVDHEVAATVRCLLAGAAVPGTVDQPARFKAACLLIAKTKGIGFYDAWLSRLEAGEMSGGVLSVVGGTSLQRRHVGMHCESALLAACRHAGLPVERLRFE